MITRFSSAYTNWSNTRLKWIPTSDKELEASETKIFSFLKNKFKTYGVDVSEQLEDNEKKNQKCKKNLDKRSIWTIEMDDPKTSQTPIVLLHGFAAGIAFWTLNLDSLSQHRRVFAIDMLGFGRSTRPDLLRRDNPEDDLVDSIEIWRKNVGLEEKFILLGHSFGAYVAASYALKYGDKLDQLVFADPWGFSNHSVSRDIVTRIPMWARIIFRVSSLFNPLAILRASGPYGPNLIRFRDDLRMKFNKLMGSDSDEILSYAFHCNANKPSGERVFKALLGDLAAAKRPIIERANQLPTDLKLNFLYANHSWLYREEESELRKLLPNHQIDYKVLDNAGHHLYADNCEGFNDYLNNLEKETTKK